MQRDEDRIQHQIRLLLNIKNTDLKTKTSSCSLQAAAVSALSAEKIWVFCKKTYLFPNVLTLCTIYLRIPNPDLFVPGCAPGPALHEEPVVHPGQEGVEDHQEHQDVEAEHQPVVDQLEVERLGYALESKAKYILLFCSAAAILSFYLTDCTDEVMVATTTMLVMDTMILSVKLSGLKKSDMYPTPMSTSVCMKVLVRWYSILRRKKTLTLAAPPARPSEDGSTERVWSRISYSRRVLLP